MKKPNLRATEAQKSEPIPLCERANPLQITQWNKIILKNKPFQPNVNGWEFRVPDIRVTKWGIVWRNNSPLTTQSPKNRGMTSYGSRT